MKTKFSRILGVIATIALLASFLAAPIAADVSQPGVTLDDEEISATTTYAVRFDLGEELATVTSLEIVGTGNTAEWVTDAPTGYTTTSAAKLTCVGTGLPNWVAAKVAYGDTLATLVGFTATKGSYTVLDVAFNVWVTDDPVNYAALWIDEDADGILDTRATGGFDVRADGTPGIGSYGGWNEMYKVSTAMWQLRDYDPATGAATNYTGNGPGAVTSLPAYLADPDCDTAIVQYVGVAYTSNASPTYVADIAIDGTTYNLVEPAVNTITITFPVDTIVPVSVAGATIQASPGWIRGQWADATTAGVTFASDADELTVTATFSAGDQIGEGATVRIEVPGITNPDESGDYTLEVETSEEDDPVESATYTIEVPDVPALEGIVELYNPKYSGKFSFQLFPP